MMDDCRNLQKPNIEFFKEFWNTCSCFSYDIQNIYYYQRFFDQVGHQTMYASMGNEHYFTKACQWNLIKTFQNEADTPLITKIAMKIFWTFSVEVIRPAKFLCQKLSESF